MGSDKGKAVRAASGARVSLAGSDRFSGFRFRLLGERRADYAGDGARRPATGLSEADLSRIWEGQTFPAEALVAADGMRLRVIYRGRASRGAGPDFRDAIISAPTGLLEGDVELHVRASDFRRHGHDRDGAYDGVVLHLVLWNDEGDSTELSGGRRVPVVALGDWLERRTGEIERWLASPARWEEPCRSSTERLGAGRVRRTLDKLGEMRFRRKSAAMRRRLAEVDAAEVMWEADDVMWQAVLEVLGYGGHRERFRAIAGKVTWGEFARALAAQGRALEERRARAYTALLALDPGAVPGERRGSVRPANRFRQRLEGAAAIAARFADGGFAGRLAPLLEEEGARGAREMVQLFTVPGAVGRGRAIEIAGNAALPVLAAIGGGRYERVCERLYGLLPLPERYGNVRHLYEAFGRRRETGDGRAESGQAGGDGGDGRYGTGDREGVRVDFRRQQGMLYLFGDYCTKGGCGRCPLS